MALPLVAIPILGDLLKSGLDLIDKFILDKDLAAKAQAEYTMKVMEFHSQALAAAQAEATGQAEVNKAEAESGNWFAASWRPAIGWVCAIGFFYTFLGFPIIQWYIEWKGLIIIPPSPPTDSLMELTFGMLGLGVMRTFEKINAAKLQAAPKVLG